MPRNPSKCLQPAFTGMMGLQMLQACRLTTIGFKPPIVRAKKELHDVGDEGWTSAEADAGYGGSGHRRDASIVHGLTSTRQTKSVSRSAIVRFQAH